LAYKQNVANTSTFWVVFCEEAGSRAGGVEECGLRNGYGCDRVGAGFLDIAG
jgi:hypothetical protein